MKLALILVVGLMAPRTPEEEIRASLANWVAAANRGDWQEALKVWAPDLIGWYPGAPDDTYPREVERAGKAGPPRTTYSVDVQEVMVSGGMAVVRDVWTFTSKVDGKPGEPRVDTVKSFEVWTKQPDGAWKISRWISAPEPKK
jgi:ketosteroid isomerase-like protein